jgi:hypothetical protein
MKRVLLLLVAGAMLAALLTGPAAQVEAGTTDPFDGFEEIARADVPAEVVAQLGSDGRVLRAPDGFGLTMDDCWSRLGQCEPITVVTKREVFPHGP